MGINLQVGLSLLDGVDDLPEGLVGQLLTGQNRKRVTLLFLLHTLMQSSVTCFTSEPTTSMEPAMIPITSPE